MDSLLASYGSSDEEGEEEREQEESHGNPSKPKISGISSDLSDTPKNSSNFSSLPKPKSSVFSLPPPKSNLPNQKPSKNFPSSDPKNLEEEEEGEGEGEEQQQEDQSPASISTPNFRGQSSTDFSSGAKTSALFFSLPEPKASSVFSSLPAPKSNIKNPPNLSPSDPYPKRVVQFRPPINPSLVKSRAIDEDDDDDDDDDRDKERKRTKEFESSAEGSSVKHFLSSIPAPKNSAALGALPSSGSGRRSIVEADIPASDSNSFRLQSEVGVNSNVGGGDSHNWLDVSSSAPSGVIGVSSETVTNGSNFSNGDSTVENYDNYGSFGGYGHYGHYESNWADGSSVTMEPDTPKNPLKVPGKRGRDEVPTEIVEVRQDELMQNRPREDQVKLTGIAFGPSYQPVSTKGKPSKLHKRKHQISSLYYDMKQKEMELAERRAKGFLTKAETQAKYGW